MYRHLACARCGGERHRERTMPPDGMGPLLCVRCVRVVVAVITAAMERELFGDASTRVNKPAA